MRPIQTVATVLLLTLAAGALAVGRPGGWTPMSEDDKAREGFQLVLQAASDAYNAKYSAGENEAQASVLKVTRAQKQVVSGMNYRFTARLAACEDDCEARSCRFQVWHQPWAEDPIKVTKMKC